MATDDREREAAERELERLYHQHREIEARCA